MTSEKWNRINELFYAALEQPPDQRDRFLKDSCGSDTSLQQEVESLLAAYSESEDFIEQSAAKSALEFLQQQEVQLATGERIGAYSIVREIGRGGMGSVFLGARADDLFQKHVAIKVIKRGMATDDVLRHFRIEQQILGNFDHPNIARLIDAGITDRGLPYFIMEYVEGEPIDQYCDRHSLSITDRLKLFQQVCSAISYAHRNLVVHRDIKATNILVTSEGVPKLLDFGIAKILQSESGEKATATGLHFMTPEYASPEQAQGLPVTTLSDVYSLGVLMYELLTGHFPYRLKNRSPIEILRTITETVPQLPSTVIEDAKQESENGAEEVSKTREGSPDRLRKRLRGDLDNIVLMALRKEPQRRYQSVDQLSEDIRRHLQGLPISARKDTIAYRTARFVSRNKIPVAITALAILAIAVFGSVMQWRANKQAALFQEFGQEVSRIEASMRYVYLLPLHNIERDKQQVINRLDHIKKRMEVMGSVSYGPGHYSLGRAYLSLHRYQDAYDNLILAWEKYGYQEPATANALGLALAMLYQDKVREAKQMYTKEQLELHQAELEKQFRAPAQQFIQRGAAASEAPEYVDALLAFLEKRYPEALEKARMAEQKISWHYESTKLQGDIFRAMGVDQSRAGNLNEASILYEKARSAYLEASRKGQSDPQIHNALCSIESSMIQEIQIGQKRKSSEEAVEAAIKHCENALQVDSKDINANLAASKIYKDWAYYQSDIGNDPANAFEKSVGFAQAALKIDSENALAHLALGEIYSTRSDWELFQGRDPVPLLDRSDDSFTKASQKIPEDHQLLFLLANNSMKRAQHYGGNGADPRPSLETTIRLMTKATQLSDRKDFRSITMLGRAYHVKGAYEQEIGLDSSDSLNKSIEFFNQVLAVNPSDHVSCIWCGNSYLALADHHSNADENPNPSLDEAIKAFEKCLATDSENFWAYGGIGVAHSRKGLALQKDGKDPVSALEMSRQAFKKVLEIAPSMIGFHPYIANVELIGARYALSRRTSPEAFLKESERIVQTCLKLNPNSDECLEPLAHIYLLRAEYLNALNQPAESSIRFGIEAADKAIKINPSNKLIMAHRGRLFLLRSQMSNGLLRTQYAKEAAASFDQAFKTKAYLRKEYDRYLKEAESIALE